MLPNQSTFLGLLIVALVLGGLAIRVPALLLLALPVLVFWLFGLLQSTDQTPPHIKVKRTLSASRVLDGDFVQVKLEVFNHGPKTAQLWIEDGLPPQLEVIDGEAACLRVGAAPQTTILTYTIAAPRGVHRWQQVRVRSQQPLSASCNHAFFPCASTLWSLPRTESANALLLAPRRTRVYAGVIHARRGGQGLEFFDTREYVPGDEVRRIHWNATARTGKWITTQYEQERIADVALVLDARHKSTVDYAHLGPKSTHALFEYSVRACASLAQLMLARGNRVGLLSYGKTLDWTLPGFGNLQRERILQALARTTPGRKVVFEGLEHLPKRLFPLHSQVVLVSPLLQQDVPVLVRLQAHGFHLTVISPDPVGFEAALLPFNPLLQAALRLARLDRNRSLQALRRGHVVVLDWDTKNPLNPQLLRSLAWIKR